MTAKYLLPLAAFSLGLQLTTPAYAISEQSESESTASEKGQQDFTKMMELFKFEDTGEPIAPDQLAKGEDVAAKLLPEGSYKKIMAETMSSVIEPMLGSLGGMPLSAITTFAGIPESEVSPPDDATVKDMMEIVDPHFAERQRVIFTSVFEIMDDLSVEVEPAIRDGLAKAYARRFTAEELDDVSAFLETDSGAKFGAESLSVYSSREVIGAAMEIMPTFIERFMGQLQDVEAMMGDIPPQRKFSDLSDAERKKLAELLGVSVDDLGRSPNEEAGYEVED